MFWRSFCCWPPRPPSLFAGDGRCLAIELRNPHDPGDTQPFTALDPRQAVTPAPYALHAPTQAWGGMYITTEGGASKPYHGYSSGSHFAYHYLENSTGSWEFYNQGTRITVQSDGNVGLGERERRAECLQRPVRGRHVPGSRAAGAGTGVIEIMVTLQ